MQLGPKAFHIQGSVRLQVVQVGMGSLAASRVEAVASQDQVEGCLSYGPLT